MVVGLIFVLGVMVATIVFGFVADERARQAALEQYEADTKL